ncbi:MAG: hypothetical protein E7325_00475 [Clostridiales bacterium]|nr:hypothetical protein [Clostridiales bacterium]
MRYHIDTIPIWDAVKLDGECPLCALERKTELGEAERYLGASVMEPDIRIKVNDRGFCRKHHQMLFSMSNRLGHALMLESHTIENRKKTSQIFEKMNRAADQLINAGLGDKLNGKTKNAAAVITGEADKLTQLSETCLMCDTIRENMLRYLHTFFHLYKQDKDFSSRIAGGKGFCLPHTGQLIAVAAEELNSRELGEFIRMITRIEAENLDRIQEDISWFIKKFDYRYESESWKNSRDAVERTVNKTRGWCVGKEPVPEE